MNMPIPKPGILDIAAYIPGKAKADGHKQPIKLSANENALGCSPTARAAYEAAAGDLNLYPDSRVTALREALAEKHGLEPARILFGTGSDEIFNMICQGYMTPRDNIVQPAHGFAAWGIAAQGAGGLVKSAPERECAVDVDALFEAVDERTRAVFIANPASPTGTVIPFAEIARLHARLPPNVILVLDEAYVEFARGMPGYGDGIELARSAPNVVVTRTFSKLYGLAALRVGWAYVPPAVSDALERIRLPFNISRPAQAAAIAALGDDVFVERSIAHAQAGRDALATTLTRLGFDVLASATNFVTARAPVSLEASEIERQLSERGILVRGLANYGLPDHLRITIGVEPQMAVLARELATIVG